MAYGYCSYIYLPKNGRSGRSQFCGAECRLLTPMASYYCILLARQSTYMFCTSHFLSLLSYASYHTVCFTIQIPLLGRRWGKNQHGKIEQKGKDG
jgi:EamA domain-containing membrane protein RarD